MNRHSWSF